MLRLASVSAARCLTRSDSRKPAGGCSPVAGYSAAAALQVVTLPVPVLNQRMVAKLANACRRGQSTLAAPTPLSPVKVSPLVSPRGTPRMTPVASRRNSVTARVSHGLVRGAGGAAVISPFMPQTFSRCMQTRAQAERTKLREHEEKQTHPVHTGSTPVIFPHRPTGINSLQYPRASGAVGGGDSTADRILKNQGLSQFLQRVYSTTGSSVAATLVGSWALSGLIAPAGFMACIVGGLVGSLGSLFVMFRSQPAQIVRPGGQLVTVNSTGRKAAFATFVGANSVMLVPLVAMCSAIHPLIVPVAAVGAGSIMAISSLVAYRKPSGSLLSLQGPLMGVLGTMILMQIGAAASVYFLGPNLFSGVMYTAYPYAALGLFSVMTAVDTHTAVAEYEAGKADHLIHATSFYLNAINIFTALARIISDLVDR